MMLESDNRDALSLLEEWYAWQKVVNDTLASLWLLRDTIAEISKKYYDGQSPLFSEVESLLNEIVLEAECLAKAYQASGLPSDIAIDLAALESFTKEQVPAAVGEEVARAHAEALQCFGQWEAAWAVTRPYALASIERLRERATGKTSSPTE